MHYRTRPRRHRLILLFATGATFLAWSGAAPSPKPAAADGPSEKTANGSAFSASNGPTLSSAHSDAQRSSAPDDLVDLESRFTAVAAKVSPAVVAISAATEVDDSPSACRCEEMSADRLQAFLSKSTRMVGTGFIIDADGYVLTNDHVIDDAQQLWITTDDRKVYPAFVVGSDPRADLAVLKIPGRKLPTVHLGDGAAVQRGQWSIAIGNPYGLSGNGGMCLSVGVVSAVNRSLPKLSDSENRLYVDLIQTTAQINPGNSGGPLFDLHGDVIGINTAVIMPQKSTNGIGFAMPIDSRLLREVEQLKHGTEIVYAWLGVIVSNPSERDREVAGISRHIGVHVDSIQPESPASGIILEDDLITAIDRRAIVDSDSFVHDIGSAPVDRLVTIELMRSGDHVTRQVKLRKRRLAVPAVSLGTQHLRWAGMLVGPAITDGQVTGLAVLDIDASSPFVKQGIHEGSVIYSVAGKTIRSLSELQTIINDTPIERCAVVTQTEQPTVTAGIR